MFKLLKCKARSICTVKQRDCRLSQFQEFSSKVRTVLGIETSCDDTGAAIVDENGLVLGNSLNSQTATTVELGGVLPTHAKVLHEAHIEGVVTDALQQANLEVKDVDAIAVTVKPGLAICLDVGLRYAQKLVLEHRVPMIPIHHMEAHALTVRMTEKVDFPYLVMLMSGGHCLLAVARGHDDFLLLGKSTDIAPGDALDKTARRMKLKNLPELYGLSGGASIEHQARGGDPTVFTAPDILTGLHTCDFSFSGMQTMYTKYIQQQEQKQGIVGNGVISNTHDICASIQYCILKHVARSLQRAFIYCELKELLPHNKTLVLSGGVACNSYFRAGLEKVCDMYDSRLVCPPPHLCTDNGMMIAWNGMEKLVAGTGVVDDPQSVTFAPKSPLGVDLRADVSRTPFKVPRINKLLLDVQNDISVTQPS